MQTFILGRIFAICFHISWCKNSRFLEIWTHSSLNKDKIFIANIVSKTDGYLRYRTVVMSPNMERLVGWYWHYVPGSFMINKLIWDEIVRVQQLDMASDSHISTSWMASSIWIFCCSHLTTSFHQDYWPTSPIIGPACRLRYILYFKAQCTETIIKYVLETVSY